MRVRLSVRAKLFGGFAIVLALLAVVGVIGLIELGSVGKSATRIGEDALPSVTAVKEIDGAAMDYRGTQFAHVAAANTQELEQLSKHLRTTAADVAATFAAYEPLISTTSERQLYTTIRAEWKSYLAATNGFEALSLAGNDAAAKKILDGAIPTYDRMAAGFGKWETESQQHAAGEVAKSNATQSSARTLIVALLAVAVLLGAAIAFLIARQITGGVGQMLRAALGIADGDVEQTITVTSKDEIGETAAAFGTMIAYLKGMAVAAERIAAGDLTVEIEPKSPRDVLGHAFATMAAKLRHAIGQVAQAATVLGASSQQMASSSEETGKAVSEIAQAVSDVASGAERQVRMVDQARVSSEQTGAAAEEANAIAQQGVAAAEQASGAMQALREQTGRVTDAIRTLAEKSEQIGGIVETITGIAGQTNLLALNAAIEAARAGEQGRGFAVVAEEVRKLAEESQSAATTISSLIAEIQEETERTVAVVEASAAQAEESGVTVETARDAFQQIGASVENIRAQIAQIVTATADVATVAEESSASTEQVSASTEETSASAEEIAASAQELAGTAEELTRLVGEFKVTA